MNDPIQVFDRHAVRLHRDRAAPKLDANDYLRREVAVRLLDRLFDIKRDFPAALDLGCATGTIGRVLKGQGGIETLVQCDLSPRMAERAGGIAAVADEEALPFANARFDLILSCLSLHWVNDLPGALVQIRRALKPDGLFLAAMYGGGTCAELRQALSAAEVELEGGLSPRVSPFAEVRDAGNLLQRAGFALPVVDSDTLSVSYPDPIKLMTDLRVMGETNAVMERRKGFTRRETMAAAIANYAEKFAAEDGRVPATFEVIFLTAWAPHPSQQKPLAPGSAKARLADALGAPSFPFNEKTEDKS
ncbi:MAG: methyltransferase domain-containing protein [Rhodospirillales bacterium]|nr:methyltransferase domain-containing protein [Rhodospirillales bacterium]